MAYWLLHRDTKISFKITMADWMMPVLFIFILISIAIPTETGLNDWIQTHLASNNLYVWIGKQLLDGGILIPFIAYFFSLLFGKYSIKCDLDLSSLYGELTAKILFTSSILINCVGFFVFVFKHYPLESEASHSLLVRLAIWIISAISIWFPVGKGCIGRIGQNKNNEKAALKKSTFKEIISYYFPILFIVLVIGVIFLSNLMEIEIIQKYLEIVRSLMYFGAGGFFIVVSIILIVENPSETSSDKRLVKSIQNLSDLAGRYHYYKNVRYSVKKDENQVEVYIFHRNVYYEKNQSEADAVFSKKNKIFFDEQELYPKIRKYLNDVVKERNAFLSSSFQKCREDMQCQLESEM